MAILGELRARAASLGSTRSPNANDREQEQPVLGADLAADGPHRLANLPELSADVALELFELALELAELASQLPDLSHGPGLRPVPGGVGTERRTATSGVADDLMLLGQEER